jgi:HEAT repeat protein
VGLVEADAQPSQRTDASIKIEKSVEVMNSITSKPYSFDRQGTLIGRTEMDRETWTTLARQLSDGVVSARPSDIDEKAIDDIVRQLLDPLAWDFGPLDRALGHIGSRAAERLVGMIQASSDSLIRYHLSEDLTGMIGKARNADIDDQAIEHIADLLENSDQVVRISAAQALGAVGPRARPALPLLEKRLQEAREAERAAGVYLGPRVVDILGMSISQIKGEPIHLPY